MLRHHAPGEGQHKNASGEEADEEQCPPAALPPVPTTHLRRRGACGACGEACGGLREGQRRKGEATSQIGSQSPEEAAAAACHTPEAGQQARRPGKKQTLHHQR